MLISVAGVATATALWVGLGLTVACLLVAGLLRFAWAYWLGWAVQVAAIAVGFVVTTMFFLGAIFLALWATAYFLGRKIEVERAEWEAAGKYPGKRPTRSVPELRPAALDLVEHDLQGGIALLAGSRRAAAVEVQDGEAVDGRPADDLGARPALGRDRARRDALVEDLGEQVVGVGRPRRAPVLVGDAPTKATSNRPGSASAKST